MEDINRDADALGAQLFMPVMLIFGIVLASSLIYCLVQCSKSRRESGRVAVVFGKDNIVIPEFTVRTLETQLNNGLNSREDHSISSSSCDSPDTRKNNGCYPQSLRPVMPSRNSRTGALHQGSIGNPSHEMLTTQRKFLSTDECN